MTGLVIQLLIPVGTETASRLLDVKPASAVFLPSVNAFALLEFALLYHTQ